MAAGNTSILTFYWYRQRLALIGDSNFSITVQFTKIQCHFSSTNLSIKLIDRISNTKHEFYPSLTNHIEYKTCSTPTVYGTLDAETQTLVASSMK